MRVRITTGAEREWEAEAQLLSLTLSRRANAAHGTAGTI